MRRQIRWVGGHEYCWPHRRRLNINGAGGYGRRINTATSEYRALGFLLRTTVMRTGILREINEACHGRSRGDGNTDQRGCNP